MLESTTTWARYDLGRERAGRPPAVEGAILGAVLVFGVTILLALLASYLDQPTRREWLFEPGGFLGAVPAALHGILHYRWTPPLALATGTLSLGLVLLLHLRWREVHGELQARIGGLTDELQRQANQNKSERATARRTLLATESARKELEAQVTFLKETNRQLEEALDKRRRVEAFLAQQRRELVRSKDVLELHVQAREEELEKLQRRNEMILNAAGEGICGVALDGTIAFANPAAARITGWQIEELIGNSEEKIFGKLLPGTDGVGAETNQPQNAPPPFTRRDGSLFLAEYIKSPIEEFGARVGFVLIFRDVTARRHAEQRLEEKAAELARSNAELEQFAFVASHDLQEPLRKILSFGDRLKTRCDAVQLADGRDYLERMQSAAARMQTLINDLLSFSRVISRTLPFAPVDLNVVVQEVLSDLEVRIERSRAKVEVAPLPTIEADPIQMRQLIQNLVSNALKFQQPGATPVVRIQARCLSSPAARARLAFASRPGLELPGDTEDSCELTVEDNGIGFDEKYLDRIFAVFQRLHGRQEYEGTGIGLAVCRRIVDRHGGMITAHSQPGQGATFVVRLPVRQATKTEIPA